MSYISSLNLLGEDSSMPISEEALSEELALWANAQFTFDTKPGSALPDDSYKLVAEQQNLFVALQEQQQYNLLNSTNHTYHTNPIYSSSSSSPSLPRIAPAPQTFNKLPIQPLNKDVSGTAASTPVIRKRKAPTTSTTAVEKKDKDAQEAIDDDKRKRNTAASARFRMKKKIREQELEKSAKEMQLKAEALEKRVAELEKEAQWLRALVVEKDPSLLK